MSQTMILPGTYIEVRDEGLIRAGGVATGNIGIVGTAEKGPLDEVKLLSSLSEAKEIFGDKDKLQDGTKELTLIRALELIYKNGGKTVYAVRTGKDATPASYTLKKGKAELLKLAAKTPGTWGNNIGLEITTLEENKQEVKLFHGVIEEKYDINSVAELKTQIDKKSVLVTATFVEPKTSDNEQELPDDIPNNPDLFSNGTNGENAEQSHYENGLALLENEIINIVLLAGQDDQMVTVLEGHLKTTADIKRERIGIIGSSLKNGKDDLNTIAQHTLNSDRLIFTAPGILSTSNKQQNKLPGAYTAAAVAGLIASVPPKTSPTNKTLVIEGLTTEFNSSQLEKLVSSRVLAVEKRNGYRIVKGITTEDGAWTQITTRRIVDYAIYGVRSSCDPYIGKLNNERVRGAMKATIDSFLTGMVEDEALVSYELDVAATRDQEIQGKVMVTMTLQPTFSIDFIQVTMYLG
ncbi:MAG: phage tail sheath C-terminal domain-containing protein [Cyanobacteria bacterium P01_H01_bin.35]